MNIQVFQKLTSPHKTVWQAIQVCVTKLGLVFDADIAHLTVQCSCTNPITPHLLAGLTDHRGNVFDYLQRSMAWSRWIRQPSSASSITALLCASVVNRNTDNRMDHSRTCNFA